MRVLMKTAAVLLGLAVLLVGASFNVLRAQNVGASDAPGRTVVTESRPISAEVTTVRLEGSIDVFLMQGNTPKLSVHAEQRLLPNIVTVAEGKTLRISTKGLIVNPRKPLQVELVLPVLQQLKIAGSGDAKVSGFSGESLDLSIDGSGNIDFNGKVARLNGNINGSGDLKLELGDSDMVSINQRGSGDVQLSGTSKGLQVKLMGSGDLHSANLKADRVNVSIMGSGDAKVYAKSAAHVEIMGSGDVLVAGKPVERHVAKRGSGDVAWE